MSTRELQRVEVFSRVQSEALPLRDAAEMLALSYRQTKRWWRRYRREGAIGLQHRSAGRESHRAKPRAFREQVLGLLREKYSGGPQAPRFGPTLAAEHLAEEDGLYLEPRRCGAGCWSTGCGCARAGASLRICTVGRAKSILASWCNWTAAFTPGTSSAVRTDA